MQVDNSIKTPRQPFAGMSFKNQLGLLSTAAIAALTAPLKSNAQDNPLAENSLPTNNITLVGNTERPIPVQHTDYHVHLIDQRSALLLALGLLGGGLGMGAAYCYARKQERKPNSRVVEIIEPQSQISDIGGSQESRELLSKVASMLAGYEKRTTISPPPSRLLIVAPDGSGKSLAIDALANAAGVPTYVKLSARDLLAPPTGVEPIELVEQAIEAGKKLKTNLHNQYRSGQSGHAILAIEDIQLIGSDAVYDQNHTDYIPLRKAWARLKSFFENERKITNQGILLVCSTTDERELAKELRDFFSGNTVEIYSPSTFEQRLDLINSIVKNPQRDRPENQSQWKLEIKEDDLKQLAKFASGLRGVEIKYIISQAASLALQETANLVENELTVNADNLMRILADTTLGHARNEDLSPEILSLVKFHDLSHLLVATALEIEAVFFSTVPRGDSLARVLVDDWDLTKWPSNRNDLLKACCAAAAGNAGERAITQSLNTTRSAEADYKRIAKIGLEMFRHGFIGPTPRINLLETTAEQKANFEETSGRFIKAVVDLVSDSMTAVFSQKEMQEMLAKVPDISANATEFYGEKLDQFIQSIISPEKLAQFREELLKRINSFSL